MKCIVCLFICVVIEEKDIIKFLRGSRCYIGWHLSAPKHGDKVQCMWHPINGNNSACPWKLPFHCIYPQLWLLLWLCNDMEWLDINEWFIQIWRGQKLGAWRCVRLEYGVYLCHITLTCVRKYISIRWNTNEIAYHQQGGWLKQHPYGKFSKGGVVWMTWLGRRLEGQKVECSCIWNLCQSVMDQPVPSSKSYS